MARRMGVYLVASSLAWLASAAVHVHSRSAAARMATPLLRLQQPTVTPTNWQAQARVVARVVDADSTDTPIEGARVILYAGVIRCDWSILTDTAGTFGLSCYDLHFENKFIVPVFAANYHPWQASGLLYDRVELQPELELIAATSVVHKVPLVTRDQRILASRVVPLARLD